VDTSLKLLEGLIPGLIVIAVLFRIFSGFFRGASSDPVSREYLGLPSEESEQDSLRTILERRAEQRRRQAQEAVGNVAVAELPYVSAPFEGLQVDEPEPITAAPLLLTGNPTLYGGQSVSWDIGVKSASRESTIKGRLASRHGLRQAILVSEILRTPRGFRSFGEEQV
jgi:hypothetical protein